MLADLGSENMGTTADGRIVMNDAEAFGTQAWRALHPASRQPNPARTQTEHADALVRAILAQPGAPRVRAWWAAEVGARVYFPNRAFVSVGRDGSVKATQRGRATFLESELRPGERRAYRAGLAAYLRELQGHVEQAWSDLEETHEAALARELAEVRRKYPRISDEDAREMAEFRMRGRR
jgi:hypothetical protein